jgi:nucleotide-binding universal stress UspA family protein
MSYKTILVHITPDERCATRVESAIRLALRFDAHLVALYTLEHFVLPSYLLVQVGEEIIQDQKEAAAAEMERAKADFIRRTSSAGIGNVEWRTASDDPVDAMVLHARYADLAVLGQSVVTDNLDIATGLPARVTLAAGRPVLILPSIGSFPTTGTRVLVAWDASREATRAVTDAIPLLKLASNVHVMSVDPRRGKHGCMPGADIGLFLARHGVHVEVTTDPGADIDVGNELLSRAADLSADLIVMGGYGHTRLREWVLGGATRTILQSMTVPVLMSH